MDTHLPLPIEDKDPTSFTLHYSPDNLSDNKTYTILIHILSTQRINPNTIKVVLTMAWQTQSEVTFKLMAINPFLVSFGQEADKLRVCDKGPWSVKGKHVILKEWNPNVPFDNVEFKETSFWLQVHSLPRRCINLETAKVVGHLAEGFMRQT